MNIMHTMASDARTTQPPKRRFYSPELKLQVVLLKFEWVSSCHIDQLLSVN